MHTSRHVGCRRLWLAMSITLGSTLLAGGGPDQAVVFAAEVDLRSARAFRGPYDVVTLPGQRWCVTANELSSTISLVDLERGVVVDEQPCGTRPMALAAVGQDEVLVSCHRQGTLERYAIRENRLHKTAEIPLGFEPLGMAVHATAGVAFVGLQATAEVATVSLVDNTITGRFPTGSWPRYMALSPDGTRLAVGCSGDGTIAIHDASQGEQLYSEPLSGGINLGQLHASRDGLVTYFPWMVYRSNPITVSNIQRGWVLASRLGRVRLDGPSYREAISLDVPRRAMADVHGLAVNEDESRIVVTSSGTHELLVYRLRDLPFTGAGGPGDLIDRKLLRDTDLFYRIELGGRPLAVRHLGGDRYVVANHTLDQLQVVDTNLREVVATISIGESPDDAEALLAHRGLQLFHDASHSLDQWYSCASCHLDGGSNARAMDTWNDGSELTPKTVLPLTAVTETGPWTWHGWQENFRASIEKSFTETMQGPGVSDQDVTAMISYLATLQPTPSPFLEASGQLSVAAERGRQLFLSSEVGCSNCHSGDKFTDGQIHDVGLNSPDDRYDGYNTPTLLGLHRKVRYLHDGRAKSLEAVLTKYHRASEIGGGADLDEQQLSDLIAYLKSL